MVAGGSFSKGKTVKVIPHFICVSAEFDFPVTDLSHSVNLNLLMLSTNLIKS